MKKPLFSAPVRRLVFDQQGFTVLEAVVVLISVVILAVVLVLLHR